MQSINLQTIYRQTIVYILSEAFSHFWGRIDHGEWWNTRAERQTEGHQDRDVRKEEVNFFDQTSRFQARQIPTESAGLASFRRLKFDPRTRIRIPIRIDFVANASLGKTAN
ncbi:MAG: hypothetical protein JWM11_7782 [Planctomycetaceae bacterium]|nr:hypothetical protein [Planctomycetaceae bacterium]